jgi:ParB family transcriptional regulator, chromosome partitioning protein
VADARRGMGRGLDAILPRGGREDGLRQVPVDLIDPNPRQPRRMFDQAAIAELSISISERGVLQPVVVSQRPGGRYELVAGERRLRAVKLAGLPSIPAMVRDTDDWERLDLALAENMAREDLNPVEAARACAMLVDDLGITNRDVARRVGRSRVAISNLIRLLDLPEEVLETIERGELTEGHGRAILLCKDHAQRRRLATSARGEGWSVRETERRARELQSAGNGDGGRGAKTVTIHPDLREALAAAEDTLASALGHPVKVKPRGDGCRVEMDLETPAEAVALAERILAGGARSAA